MLDAGVARLHPTGRAARAGAGQLRAELQEPDRFAHQARIPARRRARCCVRGRPHQQHLLLAGVLLARIEQEAVGVPGRHEPRQHRARAEHVGIHDQHGTIERVARRPQGEDRAFPEPRVGEATNGDAVDRTGERGAHLLGSEARDHHRLAHPGIREALQQPAQQALAADLDQALGSAARGVQQALADPGGEDDGRHPAPPSTSPSATRNPSRSARRSAPMFATRNASFANHPCPS